MVAIVSAMDSARKVNVDEAVAWLTDRVAVYIDTAIGTWNTTYRTISTYSDDSFNKCEQYMVELRNEVDGLITWCNDVILAIRMTISWLLNNVAMAIMTISDLVYPRNDLFSTITPDGRFDVEMFLRAARMDLMKEVYGIIKSLATRFIYSKTLGTAARGAIVYKNAIFSSSSTAYNVMVVLVYICIVVVCRRRFKIAALLRPWTKRYTSLLNPRVTRGCGFQRWVGPTYMACIIGDENSNIGNKI